MRNRINRFSLKNIYGSLVSRVFCHVTFLSKYRAVGRRLLYLSIVVPFLVILLGSSFASVLTSLLSQPVAYADANGGANYAVNVNSGQAAAVDSCIQDGKCTVLGLKNVEAAVRGGVFGDSAITLNYEPDEDLSNVSDTDPPNPEPPQMFFTGNYTCGQDNLNYTVSVLLYISNYKSTTANPYSGQLYLDNIKNDANGNDTNDLANGPGDGYLDAGQIQSSGIPSSCIPSNVSTGSGQPSLTHTFNVTNYANLSPTLKTAFSSAIGNPPAQTNPGGGGGGVTPPTCGTPATPPCFVCNSGTDILGFIPNPLDFLLCGIINGMYLIVSNLDTQINNMLEIGVQSPASGTPASDDPNQIFADTNSCPGGGTSCSGLKDANAYQSAWEQFRNIALALLVVVALIIIIAQALGMEILDAYTIRKMLPRVLIATIGITLSWSIMRFLVTLSNDLGYGVGDLIGAPFSKLGIDIQFGAGGSVLATAVAAGSLAVFDLFGLMGFVGTAMVAVLITFVVLIIRQIAVVLLIVFAPVAMIAYVLPGTQRYYKFWWESLSKMLLMFPMIVALITAGHIFSAISSTQAALARTNHNGTLALTETIIAIFAYFAPYFMVPLTFRFSGTVMGTIGGAVNSRGEGARGALRNFRSNRRKQNIPGLRRGDRWKGTSMIPGSQKLAQKVGTVTSGLGTGIRGNFGIGPGKGSEARAALRKTFGAEDMKDPRLQALRGDDNFLRAMNAGNSKAGRDAVFAHMKKQAEDEGDEFDEAEANVEADRAVNTVMANGGFSTNRQVAAFTMLSQGGTGIRDQADMVQLATTAAHGNAHAAGLLMAEGVSVSGQVGRSASLNPGTGDAYKLGLAAVNAKTDDDKEALQRQLQRSSVKAAGSQSMYQLVNSSKGIDIKNAHRAMINVLSDDTAESIDKENAYKFIKRFEASGTLGGQTAVEYGKKGREGADAAIELYKKSNPGAAAEIDEAILAEKRALSEDQINAAKKGGAPPATSGEGEG